MVKKELITPSPTEKRKLYLMCVIGHIGLIFIRTRNEFSKNKEWVFKEQRMGFQRKKNGFSKNNQRFFSKKRTSNFPTSQKRPPPLNFLLLTRLNLYRNIFLDFFFIILDYAQIRILSRQKFIMFSFSSKHIMMIRLSLINAYCINNNNDVRLTRKNSTQ